MYSLACASDKSTGHLVDADTENAADEQEQVLVRSLTWNIEGLKRNYQNLKHFTDIINSDLIFLSEPKVFQNDLPCLVRYLPNYKFYLNSEYIHAPEVPFVKNQTFGGTMVGWKNELDAHISLPSFYLPVVLSLPGTPVTVHIAKYLPTSGQESEFADQITSLRNTVQKLREDYPVSLVYLRGD